MFSYRYRTAYPISDRCPGCGGGNFRTVDPDTTVAFRSDRVCTGCGARYTPPTPRWAALTFCVIGAAGPVVSSLIMVLCYVVLREEYLGPFRRPWNVLVVLVVVSVFFAACFRYGLWCLRTQRPPAGPGEGSG